MPRTHKIHGFTLIELMIVLAILGVMAAVATVVFQGLGRDRRLQVALEQFQTAVSLAQQRAILQPAMIGMLLTRRGYFFVQYWQGPQGNSGGWRPLEEDKMSNTAAFDPAVRLHLKVNDQAIVLPHSHNLEVAGEGAEEDDDSKALQIPHVIFLPNGEITPFSLTVRWNHRSQVLNMGTSI